MAKKKPTVFLGATIEPEVNEVLEKEAEKTGNKSFLVNKALRQFFLLDLHKPTNQEPAEKAS